MAKVKHISYSAEELEQILTKNATTSTNINDYLNQAQEQKYVDMLVFDGHQYLINRSIVVPHSSHEQFGLVKMLNNELFAHDVDKGSIKLPVVQYSDGCYVTLPKKSELRQIRYHIGTLDEIVSFFTSNEMYIGEINGLQ